MRHPLFLTKSMDQAEIELWVRLMNKVSEKPFLQSIFTHEPLTGAESINVLLSQNPQVLSFNQALEKLVAGEYASSEEFLNQLTSITEFWMNAGENAQTQDEKIIWIIGAEADSAIRKLYKKYFMPDEYKLKKDKKRLEKLKGLLASPFGTMSSHVGAIRRECSSSSKEHNIDRTVDPGPFPQ